MIINVKIIQGPECSLEVAGSASITFVKQLVAQELDVPVDQQRLIFKGKTLSDEMCIQDYDIVEGTKLHLVVKKSVEQNGLSPAFSEHLTKMLARYYHAADIPTIISQFRKELGDRLKNMSLDDVERLASENLMGEATSSRSTET